MTKQKGAKDFVKQNLWQRNNRVKDVSKLNLGYDLMVNEKQRVLVGSLSGETTLLNIEPDQFDVLAVVYLGDMDHSAYYLSDKKDLEKLKLGDVYAVSRDVLRQYFTRKPGEIFN